MKARNVKAIKLENGDLLARISGANYCYISSSGKFIKWSSRREWVQLLKQNEQITFNKKIKIPLEEKNIFTLRSGSYYDKQPEETREVTLKEIFSLNVGDEIRHDAANSKRCAWFGRLLILGAPSKNQRLVMVWSKETTNDEKPMTLMINARIYLVNRNGKFKKTKSFPNIRLK